jgi:peptidyl-prolyl cis-trans isomerase-like 3
VPKISENFLALAASNYYDGCVFHRNMREFMVQTGDPTNKGNGGESIWGGKIADEFHPELRHDKPGVLSMANNGPNTNGSQFFITYGPQPHLNNVYCVFGRVIHGLDVLKKMERVPVGARSRPLTDIELKSVTIHANPLAE